MNTRFWYGCWLKIGIVLAATSGYVCSQKAIAQIVPDRTLGAESSIVTPADIKGLPSDRIDAGAIRGANLFHSFQEFNIRDGRGAYFSNPTGIENIFSRVTGTNASNIFGKLGVLGNANLFLLNPNGIIFGSNASLDIAGSFSASTANSLNFGDDKFSATNPTDAPLLSVKVPLGVQFNQNQPSAIANSGNLSVGTGQNLNLMGGTVVSTGQLSAPSGQVAVASVPGGSVVNLSPSAQFLNIQTSSPVASVGTSSLSELLTSVDERSRPGLTVNSNGQVELAGSGLPVVDGDVVAKNVTAQTATLTAKNNLTLVESQLGTNGDLNLLAGNTVRVRDSVANPFVAQAGGKLLVQGRQGVDIFALNNSSSGLVSGGDMVLRSGNTVGGDAHYWAGGNFRIEELDGSLGGLFSPYDPIIRASGDVSFASYRGNSLHILAGGSVRIDGTVEITGADANALRENEPLELLDGTTIRIDGTQFPTLDIRAGTTNFGFPELTPPVNLFPGAGNIFPNPLNINLISPKTRQTGAQISIGSIINRVRTTDSGQVFLTNRYFPDSTLPGGLIEIRNQIVDPEAPGLGSFSIRAYGNPVTIDARGDVRVAGIITGRGDGNGGDIKILSESTIDTTGGNIRSLSNGRAGDVTLRANGNINSGRIEASNSSTTDDPDNFSTIRLESLEGSVILNNVQIAANNNGSDYSGIIDILAPQGNVEIRGDRNINPGVDTIVANGYYGIINIQAGNDITIRDSLLTAQTPSYLPAPGQNISRRAGEIDITSQNGNIDIRNNSSINSSTSVRFDDEPQINVNAGNININAKNGSVLIGSPWLVSQTDRSQVLSRNSGGRGDAGNVTIKAERGTVSIAGIKDNGDATVATDVAGGGVGNAGELTITGRSVDIKDEAIVAASIINGNVGEGENGRTIAAQAGNVNIMATDTVSVNNSVVFSEIGSTSVGNGGKVNVTAPKVNLDEVAFLVTIVREGGQGKGGEININTDSLSLKNGSLLATSTSGNSISGIQGGAGNVTIRGYNTEASNTVFIDGRGNNNKSVVNIPSLGSNPIPSAILSTVEAAARGENNGGNIDILTGSLEVTNSGRVSATNFAQGRAGDVSVSANSVLLRGTNPNTDFRKIFENNQTPQEGLLAEATKEGGTAGGIGIETDELRIENGATVTVSSPEGKAGNLFVFARKIFLDNGALLATTGQPGNNLGGANILLFGNETTRQALLSVVSLITDDQLRNQGKKSLPGSPLDFLILKNESLIETNAKNSVDGGNIAIKTRLLLALPPTGKNGSDISANAKKTGRGGVVAIDPRPLGIYGTKFRPKTENTPLNDITASSEQGPEGTVAIVPIDADPERGLLELPEDLGDSSRSITPSCPVGRTQAASRFVVTGRGGLPPSPSSALSSDVLMGNTTTNVSPRETRSIQSTSPSSTLVEAKGMNIGPKGEIIFTANPSKSSSDNSWQRNTDCNAK
ncbi:MAG: filamentous hemagglutinin N-terminal domain-containing protein [Cyanomargarita calcarea GSE-NOS-MK-12-04C]|jgi:filamentous hemagglutinin family protein|uniref:Filamentous hemagglutinin N-terminal domain-containing protein n=1 Tax=Cyanomargarita calcarea GSE-NOS-MK-12-04C TaxID=2839659 RepID=A0A951QS59_9CYAN|nr:filamentous hemagglutinin N-terminal domain-containing protein [Cyanomargarita calcarea GSE-NOS-MK-12-04C]